MPQASPKRRTLRIVLLLSATLSRASGAQRAIRDGDWKYLQIAGNEFLFDVVKDPRERANHKERDKDVFERLKADWVAWNDTMLPERNRPARYSNPGNFLADHYGVVNAPPAPGPAAQR